MVWADQAKPLRYSKSCGRKSLAWSSAPLPLWGTLTG